LLQHPSENKNVIAGQGTVSIEFVQQVRDVIGTDLDAVIIPVGGGGLAAGNTIALRGLLGNKVKVRPNLILLHCFISCRNK
jgi:threonine dehydratase